MDFPKELRYTKEHEWISNWQANAEAVVGVTSFAVEQLGDIVHVDLPKVGDTFEPGASFGTIESTKTVSDLYMPVKATITAVNPDLKSALETIQNDPYKAGWLVKVKLAGDAGSLMTAEQYQAYLNDN